MRNDRTTARIAGTLFIVGFAGVGTAALSKPVLVAPDFLARIAANGNRIALAALLQLVMAAACAGIGIALYPVLRRTDEGLALGAAGFRIIEAAFQIAGAIGLLSLLSFGEELARAGSPDSTGVRIAGALLLAGNGWINHVAVPLAWCLGALLYYWVLYRRTLLPRWLSGWGLIGITSSLVATLLVLFRAVRPMGAIEVVLNLPVALQELVMAVWLIAKGFNPPPAGDRESGPIAQVAIR